MGSEPAPAAPPALLPASPRRQKPASQTCERETMWQSPSETHLTSQRPVPAPSQLEVPLGPPSVKHAAPGKRDQSLSAVQPSEQTPHVHPSASPHALVGPQWVRKCVSPPVGPSDPSAWQLDAGGTSMSNRPSVV